MRSRLKVIEQQIGAVPVKAQETPETVEDLQKAFGNHKPATMNRLLGELRHLNNWATGRGTLAQSPFSPWNIRSENGPCSRVTW